MSDSLDQIKQINLRLRFSCLKPDCNAALAKFVVNSADGQVAVLSLRPRGDVLTVQIDQGEGGRPPAPEFYSLTLKTGETFDLRLHWTEGHRVSFDLYKADISMLGSTMESHDAQLSSNVQNLQMQVQEAELTLVNQTFVFR